MAGAILFSLDRLDDLALQVAGDGINRGADLVALVTNNGNDVFRVEIRCRLQRVVQHRPAADCMQGLLCRRFHAGAGASCKNNNCAGGVSLH